MLNTFNAIRFLLFSIVLSPLIYNSPFRFKFEINVYYQLHELINATFL